MRCVGIDGAACGEFRKTITIQMPGKRSLARRRSNRRQHKHLGQSNYRERFSSGVGRYDKQTHTSTKTKINNFSCPAS